MKKSSCLFSILAGLLVVMAAAQIALTQEDVGEIKTIRGEVYWKGKPEDQEMKLDAKQQGRKLVVGERFRCANGCTLVLVLYGEETPINDQMGWFPIPNLPPATGRNIKTKTETKSGRTGGGTASIREGEELNNFQDIPTGSRTVTSGQKLKFKGVVTRRDSDTFTVRDINGVDTVVRLDDQTSVKAKGGFLRSSSNYAQTNILRGLNLEVEGRGNSSGELVADKIRFNEFDLRVARAVESRAVPLEERATSTEEKLSQTERNAQRISGQIDELAAVANTARGGSRTAQETADAAVAGVTATNERISALDDYEPQDTLAVNFRTGSAVLSADAKTQLDEIATKALNAKGYVLEISGYADSTGSIARSRSLSQRRADAVIRYLVETHNIPLRRFVTPYGYGELNPVAENTTREGRAQNRRVEVKLLVNKGLIKAMPTMNPNP